MKNKVCEHCGTNYTPTGTNQKYCDPKCYQKKRYQERKSEKLTEYGVRWREENKEHLDNYYEVNKEKRRANTKEYHKNNKEKLAKKYKEWASNNKDKRKISQKKHYDNVKNTPKHKINSSMRKGVYRSLKGKKDFKHWGDLVGYDIDTLQEHLISTLPEGSTWEDYINNNLHIDHIIPLAAYEINSYDAVDFKKAWDIRNLRFYDGVENSIKNDKIIIDLIREYGIEDLMPENYCK